jgi:hypothetical protein
VQHKERFKDIKGIKSEAVSRKMTLKTMTKKDKMTNNELQSTTQNTKDLSRMVKTD